MGGGHGFRVLTLLLVVSGWGCAGGGGGTRAGTVSGGVASTTAVAVSSSIDKAITGFGGGAGVNPDFANLETQVRDNPDGLRAAALAHLADSNDLVHYAAVYALARTAKSTGESISALQGLLTSPRVNDRLLAAGALIFRGDRTAIPVLIDLLGSPDSMAFRDPPQTGSEFAAEQLLRFTSEDFGLRAVTDAAGAAQAKPLWKQWWDAHGSALVWDATITEFH